MREAKIVKYFLIVILVVFLYLAFITVKPLINSIVLAFVLTVVLYPVYEWLNKNIWSVNISSFLMVLFVLLIIIFPSYFFVDSLLKQTYGAYSSVVIFNFEKLDIFLAPFVDSVEIGFFLDDLIFNVRTFILDNTPNVLGSFAESIIGLFIMLFIMFYAFRDGKSWIKWVKFHLPMKKEYSEKLFKDSKKILQAVLYGVFLIAALQGLLVGSMFLILRIDSPIFWGFIAFVLAAIPFVGAALVWLPAAFIQILLGHYVGGIVLLIFGVFVISNIEHFLKPKVIGKKAGLHPVLILVGIIGGLSVFGFIGILLGPLILSLFSILAKFFALEFQ
ncbi:hypothetical protein CMO90_00665 [Candidatus Woesearchaeota archaeon]|jgi:predicted PurR-regulated permease PerM|nr:hypothetical protein [Candidatus Woesearchaeota archaeon]|tara:strand:- start:551 stop:1546 length:996 start_codon:yes stop_codon:yes gene_type:complete